MTDIDVIQRKLTFITTELTALKKYEHMSQEEILKDYVIHACIERILERIVNAAIDINSHILAEKIPEGLKVPRTYRNTFEELVNMNIYPKEFGDEIAKSAGLRNILVHEYEELNENIFYESFKKCLQAYPKYCEYISTFIENEK